MLQAKPNDLVTGNDPSNGGLTLGGHFKTGQWWSPQKRPMGMARDSVVLPL